MVARSLNEAVLRGNMSEFLCGEEIFLCYDCSDGYMNLHVIDLIKLHTKEKEQIRSAPNLTVLLQHQFPGFDNVPVLCKASVREPGWELCSIFKMSSTISK